MSNRKNSASVAGTSIGGAHFRNVLGSFPTGVVVVSALGPGGEPIGMVVGSFTSVSLEPPLVAFLPSVTSSSYAKLQSSDTFCVSVLSAEQESVCRRMASPDPNKFDGQEWVAAPSGNPILAGSVAWLDCRVVDRHRAGDHDIVVGEVTALDKGEPVGPLLFFQGGYGGFDPRALAAPFRPDLRNQLRLADVARPHLEALAMRTGLECYAQSVAGEEIVITAACGSPGGAVRTHLGRRLPLAPPYGSIFAAYSPALAAIQARNGALEAGTPGAEEYQRRLDQVRERGWSIGLLATGHDEAWDDIRLYDEVPVTPGVQRRIEDALHRISHGYEPDTSQLSGTGIDVRIIAAPVLDVAGDIVQAVTLFGFPLGVDDSAVTHWADEVVATARAISRDIAAGG